jgi:hypothetical protein
MNISYTGDMRFACIVFLFFLATRGGAGEVTYSETFSEYYPVRGAAFDLAHHSLESPTIVTNQNQRKLTVLRTRGDRYSYEEQKCVITVEGPGIEKTRTLSAQGFRTVGTSWVTGKLILIRLGIGPVAMVEAIYDTEKDAWLYRASLELGNESQ